MTEESDPQYEIYKTLRLEINHILTDAIDKWLNQKETEGVPFWIVLKVVGEVSKSLYDIYLQEMRKAVEDINKMDSIDIESKKRATSDFMKNTLDDICDFSKTAGLGVKTSLVERLHNEQTH